MDFGLLNNAKNHCFNRVVSKLTAIIFKGRPNIASPVTFQKQVMSVFSLVKLAAVAFGGERNPNGLHSSISGDAVV